MRSNGRANDDVDDDGGEGKKRENERRREERQTKTTRTKAMTGVKCMSSSWRTRCRHVVEERDGACLFKPILYRIFILMDFFNSGPPVAARLDGLANVRERALCFCSLAGCNVLHLLPLASLPRRMAIPGLSYSR